MTYLNLSDAQEVYSNQFHLSSHFFMHDPLICTAPTHTEHWSWFYNVWMQQVGNIQST